MYKINKLQRYIVQHREHSQYFIVTINGVQTKNCESLCCTPETYNIVNQLYLNFKKRKNTLEQKQIGLGKYLVRERLLKYKAQ